MTALPVPVPLPPCSPTLSLIFPFREQEEEKKQGQCNLGSAPLGSNPIVTQNADATHGPVVVLSVRGHTQRRSRLQMNGFYIAAKAYRCRRARLGPGRSGSGLYI